MSNFSVSVTDSEGNRKTYEFADERVTIGRSKKRDITISDTAVSGKHAELLWEDGELTFADVGSSNGSYLPGGDRIEQPIELQEGSIVFIGESKLMVEMIDEDERTQMLSREQLDQVLAAKRQADAAPASGFQAPAAGDGWDDGSAQPGGEPPTAARDSPQPRVPSGYPADDDPGAQEWADEPEDDWAAQAADPPDRALKDTYPPGEVADPLDDPLDDPIDEPDAPPPAPPAPSRSRNTGPKQTPATIDDESFGVFVPTLKKAVHASIDLVKSWKTTPNPTKDDIREVLLGTWNSLKPHIKVAPLPLLAVSAGVAIFSLLAALVSALVFLASLAGFVAIFANVFATAAVTLYLLEVRVGNTPDIKETVRRTLTDPKALLISIFVASAVAFVGLLAVILPGVALGAFIWPIYYVEGRNMLGLNQRSLELFMRDAKRMLVSGFVLFVGLGVASMIVSLILGVLPFVGVFLTIIFGAVWSAINGTLSAAFALWFYFDIRHHFETGDAVADTRERLRSI